MTFDEAEDEIRRRGRESRDKLRRDLRARGVDEQQIEAAVAMAHQMMDEWLMVEWPRFVEECKQA